MLRTAVFSLLFAFQVGGSDPRIGSWTLISAQSSQSPANMLSITSTQDSTHVVMSGETHLDFTAQTNGKDTPVASNPAFDQIELHRMGRRQVEVREKKNGALVATLRDKLSPNDEELTITTVSPGKPDQVTVWERSGGVKSPKDPFAGDWTEDLGKSRTRQGLTLQIEPAGSGVRFAGEDNYTAGFDGRPHDVRNSRNDTVQLALIDPHTVDAVYRRDQQVTQKDRWVVAPDGKTMTLTRTATLESGQKISEKMVFQRKS